MKEILEDLFKERTIDSGELGREIIFENEFDDMIDEIVKLCNLRIVSKRSELLLAYTNFIQQPSIDGAYTHDEYIEMFLSQ